MQKNEYIFLCDSCFVRLRTKNIVIGKQIKCPKCNSFIFVKMDENSNQNDTETPFFNFNTSEELPDNNELFQDIDLKFENKQEPVSKSSISSNKNSVFIVFCILFIFCTSAISLFFYNQVLTLLNKTKNQADTLIRNDEKKGIEIAEINKKIVEKEIELELIKKKTNEKEIELELIKKKTDEKNAEKQMELELLKKKVDEKNAEIKKEFNTFKNSIQQKNIDQKTTTLEMPIGLTDRKLMGGMSSNSKFSGFGDGDIESFNKRKGVVTIASLTDLREISENPSKYKGLTAFLPACYIKAENINRNALVNGHIFSFRTGDNIANLETFGTSTFIQKNELNFGMNSKIADDFKTINYNRRRTIEIQLSAIQDRLSVPIRDTQKWQYATANMKFLIKEISNGSYIAEVITLFVSQ